MENQSNVHWKKDMRQKKPLTKFDLQEKREKSCDGAMASLGQEGLMQPGQPRILRGPQKTTLMKTSQLAGFRNEAGNRQR